MRARTEIVRSVIALALLSAVLVMGAAAEAPAAMGKRAWEKLSPEARSAYLTGFLDFLRLSKGLDPNGYMATTYVMPPGATPLHWLGAVNRLYREPEHENRRLFQVLVIAGQELEKKFGPERTSSHAGLAALKKAIDQRREALLKEEKEGEAEKEADPDAASSEEGAAPDERVADDAAGDHSGPGVDGTTDHDAHSGKTTAGDAAEQPPAEASSSEKKGG